MAENDTQGATAPDPQKSDLDKLAELQNKVIELTERASKAEATADKLDAENRSLRSQNHELFIRATRVNAGLPADEAEEKTYPTVEDAGLEFYKTKGRAGRYL